MKIIGTFATVFIMLAFITELLVVRDPSESLLAGINKSQDRRGEEMSQVDAGEAVAARAANKRQEEKTNAMRKKRAELGAKIEKALGGKVRLPVLAYAFLGLGLLGWVISILRRDDAKNALNIIFVMAYVVVKFLAV